MKVDIHKANGVETIPIMKDKKQSWWMGIRIEENRQMTDRRYAIDFKKLLNGKVSDKFEYKYNKSEFLAILKHYDLLNRFDNVSWAVYVSDETFSRTINISYNKAVKTLLNL